MADRQHKTTGADQPSAASAASIRPTTGNQGTSVLSAFQLHQLALKRFISKLEAHLSEETEPNRKNGKSSKTLKTSAGPTQAWKRRGIAVAPSKPSPRCHPNAGGST